MIGITQGQTNIGATLFIIPGNAPQIGLPVHVDGCHLARFDKANGQCGTEKHVPHGESDGVRESSVG